MVVVLHEGSCRAYSVVYSEGDMEVYATFYNNGQAVHFT